MIKGKKKGNPKNRIPFSKKGQSHELRTKKKQLVLVSAHLLPYGRYEFKQQVFQQSLQHKIIFLIKRLLTTIKCCMQYKKN